MDPRCLRVFGHRPVQQSGHPYAPAGTGTVYPNPGCRRRQGETPRGHGQGEKLL